MRSDITKIMSNIYERKKEENDWRVRILFFFLTKYNSLNLSKKVPFHGWGTESIDFHIQALFIEV